MDGFRGKASNKDGQITAALLKNWAEETMPEITRKYAGGEQFPTGFVFGQDFPIGLK